jgi:acetyltransferase-like isoleucine patch superfamily enzyme
VTDASDDDLLAQLQALDAGLRGRMRAAYHRDLPLPELLFDRWERAASLGFGERSSVYHEAYLYGDVVVGSDVWIGPFTLIDGSGGRVEIGDGCTIAAGVHVYTHDNVLATVSGGDIPFRREGVTIGARTYVGAQALVLAGASIGSMCVVGAQALVADDVPDRAVVVGSPARVIGRVEGEGAETRIALHEQT